MDPKIYKVIYDFFQWKYNTQSAIGSGNDISLRDRVWADIHISCD